MKRLSIIVVALMLMWASCSQGNSTSPENIATDESAIERSATANKGGLLTNSETAKISEQGDKKTYDYTHYSVTTEAGTLEGDGGDKITVVNKSTGESVEVTQIGDNTYFWGIYKNLMFLDNGTSSLRVLIIYDIANNNIDSEHQFPVGENGAKIDNDKLIVWEANYNAPQEAIERCTEAKKWEEEGLTPMFQEKIIIDCGTLAVERTAIFDCFAGQ